MTALLDALRTAEAEAAVFKGIARRARADFRQALVARHGHDRMLADIAKDADQRADEAEARADVLAIELERLHASHRELQRDLAVLEQLLGY